MFAAYHRLFWLLLCIVCMIGSVSPAAAEKFTFIVQPDEHLEFARELCRAALQKTGVDAEFIYAPKSNERRKLHMLIQGKTHLDMMPATPRRLEAARRGDILMIPVPLDRGFLGWRLNLVLESQKDILANVQSKDDLTDFTIGQGEGWMDVELYRAAGIRTKEVRQWRNAEFVREMKSGFFQLFPLGLEESMTYFLPHFQQFHPELVADPHILVKYPWFRFPWVSPKAENADILYQSLSDGFEAMARDGTFLEVYNRYRSPPPAGACAGRTVIEIDNPFYGYDLVPQRYEHLLYAKDE